MAWTAKLLRLSKSHGRVEFEIRYSDGIDIPIDKLYSFERTNRKAIRALARREVARLQEIKDEAIDIEIGADIDLTEPPLPPSPPDPTPEEIARRAWFQGFDELRRLEAALNAGVILPSDSRIGSLKAKLKTTFLDEYLDGL